MSSVLSSIYANAGRIFQNSISWHDKLNKYGSQIFGNLRGSLTRSNRAAQSAKFSHEFQAANSSNSTNTTNITRPENTTRAENAKLSKLFLEKLLPNIEKQLLDDVLLNFHTYEEPIKSRDMLTMPQFKITNSITFSGSSKDIDAIKLKLNKEHAYFQGIRELSEANINKRFSSVTEEILQKDRKHGIKFSETHKELKGINGNEADAYDKRKLNILSKRLRITHPIQVDFYETGNASFTLSAF